MSKEEFRMILEQHPELWDKFEQMLDELSGDTATHEPTTKGI